MILVKNQNNYILGAIFYLDFMINGWPMGGRVVGPRLGSQLMNSATAGSGRNPVNVLGNFYLLVYPPSLGSDCS